MLVKRIRALLELRADHGDAAGLSMAAQVRGWHSGAVEVKGTAGLGSEAHCDSIAPARRVRDTMGRADDCEGGHSGMHR